MKPKLLIFVTGIGIGEDSKGASVQYVADQLSAHTVIRSGGPQSGHHLVTSRGSVCLSHFGSGVLDGIPTHLVMPIIPTNLFEEAIELEEFGVSQPFDLLTADESCLAVLPYHKAISRLREILRVEKKGTVGTGVGEALEYSRDYPALTIRAAEFKNTRTLAEKVQLIREFIRRQSEQMLAELNRPVPDEALLELGFLDSRYDQQIVDSMRYLADLIRITGVAYFEKLLRRPGVMISESSHGTLHHPRLGFIPHITQIDPTAMEIKRRVETLGYDGQIVRLGSCRSYMVRIGAGPLVSYDPTMTDDLPEDQEHNPDSAWLGRLRKGPLDLLALRYAIDICGGRSAFGGLMISHLDSLAGKADWPVCVAYQYTGEPADLAAFFNMDGDRITAIKLHSDDGSDLHRAHQMQLTRLLKDCRPVVVRLTPTSASSLEQVFLEYVNQNLDLPIVTLGQGPRKEDRQNTPAWERLFA